MATEKRLVYAREVEEIFNFVEHESSDSYKAFQVAIEKATTVDAVEVVRCKDCKHCDTENLHCDHPMGTTFPFPRKIDDFCSYGERKDND